MVFPAIIIIEKEDGIRDPGGNEICKTCNKLFTVGIQVHERRGLVVKVFGHKI